MKKLLYTLSFIAISSMVSAKSSVDISAPDHATLEKAMDEIREASQLLAQFFPATEILDKHKEKADQLIKQRPNFDAATQKAINDYTTAVNNGERAVKNHVNHIEKTSNALLTSVRRAQQDKEDHLTKINSYHAKYRGHAERMRELATNLMNDSAESK